MGDLIQLCGLWENKDKNGEIYLSGYLGDARILVYKNKYREQNEKAPHYKVFLAEKRKKEEVKRTPPPAARTQSDYVPPGDDDVPF